MADLKKGEWVLVGDRAHQILEVDRGVANPLVWIKGISGVKYRVSELIQTNPPTTRIALGLCELQHLQFKTIKPI